MSLICIDCKNDIADHSDVLNYCFSCYNLKQESLCQVCYELNHSACGIPLPYSWFRWIHLEPSSSTYDIVECTTVCTPWNDKPDYVYVSNEDKIFVSPADHLIICDGEEKYISEALHYTMVKLREGGCHRIWTETLCLGTSHGDYSVQVSQLALQAASQRCIPPLPNLKTPFSNGALPLVHINCEAKNATEPFTLTFFPLSMSPEFTYLDIEALPEDTQSLHIIISGRTIMGPRDLVQWMIRMKDEQPGSYCFIPIVQAQILHDSSFQKFTEIVRSLASQVVHLDSSMYTYSTLPNPYQSIRLLRLVRSYFNGGLYPSTDIVTVDLDIAPRYAALSYTWGSGELVCTMDNKTQKMLLTSNLRHALEDLLMMEYEYVWVDAICINQNDLEEKNIQVSRMVDIYQHAAEVVVHIGRFPRHPDPGCHHTAAVRLIEALASVAGLDKDTRTCTQMSDSELVKHGIPDRNDVGWQGWAAMYTSPWFTRSWVVQEVVVNRNVQFILAGSKISLEKILLASAVQKKTDLSRSDPQKLRQQMAGFLNMRTIGHIREEYWRESPSLTTLALMKLLNAFDASNRKDKIYAFLGIAKDRLAAPLPDYSAPLNQVFCEYSRYFMKRNPMSGLDLIEIAGSVRGNRRDTALPSWVPSLQIGTKYNVHGNLRRLQINNKGLGRRVWNAGGSKVHMKPRLESDCQEMILQGIEVGNILATTSVRLEVADVLMNAAYYPGVYKEAMEILAKYQNIYSDPENAYASTVIAGDCPDMPSDVERKSIHERVAHAPSPPLLNSKGEPEWMVDLSRSEELYLGKIGQVMEGRRFGIMDTGHMCLLEEEHAPGDVIFVVLGIPVPYAFRPSGEAYELVGECYVHGIMHGEMLGTKEPQEIRIR